MLRQEGAGNIHGRSVVECEFRMSGSMTSTAGIDPAAGSDKRMGHSPREALGEHDGEVLILQRVR